MSDDLLDGFTMPPPEPGQLRLKDFVEIINATTAGIPVPSEMAEMVELMNREFEQRREPEQPPAAPDPTLTYERYCQLRLDAGWDPELCMVRSVWERMDDEGRRSAIEQYEAMAAAHQARLAQGWGAF